MDWTGLAAFVTSIGTLVSAGAAYRRAGDARAEAREANHTIERQLAPKVDELHDRVVNGGSALPPDTPRTAPPPEEAPEVASSEGA